MKNLKAYPEDMVLSVVEIDDTHKHLADLCANFYDHPEKKISVFGITGTKGKTTTAFMLREILERSGRKSGLIGTVCNIIAGKKIHAEHTTPESREVYDMMNTLSSDGEKDLVMEVSSQALKLDRVRGITYRTAAFTNLYEDHIAPNEHPDMEDYLSCKLRIFDCCETGILNADCSVADRVKAYCDGKVKLLTYSIGGDADFIARNLRPERRGHVTGTLFELDSEYYKARSLLLFQENSMFITLFALYVPLTRKVSVSTRSRKLSRISAFLEECSPWRTASA